MKLFAALICLTFISLTACFAQEIPASNNLPKAGQSKKKSIMEYKNKKGDIEYEYKIKLISGKSMVNNSYIENDAISIEYTITNKGKKNYLLFNRGDTHRELKKGVVYIDPQPDGVIELSQKSFSLPKDKDCPDWEYPILAGASWLKAKETLKETVVIELPLKLFTPFDSCSPQAEMPKEVKKIRFCLGIAEASPQKVSIDKNGFVKDISKAKAQQLLCSDTFELK